jgi:hypothetical protein
VELIVLVIYVRLFWNIRFDWMCQVGFVSSDVEYACEISFKKALNLMAY